MRICRASGGLARLTDQPAAVRGQAQIKHLPGARPARCLKAQGHDPLFHAIPQLLRHDIDAALAVLQAESGDIVAADAAIEAVAKGAQIVEVAGRNHHLDARSVKPLIHLPGERRHLLAKHGDIRGGRPIEGGCPRRILLVL